jgi:excisionase family DNA binding protein
MEKLLKISEAAEILGVSMQTLRKWDNDGKLKPTHTLGGHRRYRQVDVDRIVAGMTDGPVKTVELLNEALSYVRDSNVKKRIEKIIQSVENGTNKKNRRG